MAARMPVRASGARTAARRARRIACAATAKRRNWAYRQAKYGLCSAVTTVISTATGKRRERTGIPRRPKAQVTTSTHSGRCQHSARSRWAWAAPEEEVPEPESDAAGEGPLAPSPEVTSHRVEGQRGEDVGQEQEEVQGGEEPHHPREASRGEEYRAQRAGVIVPARLERGVQLRDDEAGAGEDVPVARGLEVGGQEERVALVGDRRPPRREARPAVGRAPHRHHDQDEDRHPHGVPPPQPCAPDPHASRLRKGIDLVIRR